MIPDRPTTSPPTTLRSTGTLVRGGQVPWPEVVGGRRMDTYHRWMETVMPWSMAGTPVLGMPAGFDPRGLPTGVQLVGPAGADHAVLRIARAYEDATQWVARHPPEIVS